MVLTNYTYSILTDTASGSLNSQILINNISGSVLSGSGLSHINTSGDDLDIWFYNSLSPGDVTELSGVVGSHDGAVVDFKDNFIEEEYNSLKHLIKEAYYAEEDGNGDLIYKTRQVDYNYNGPILISEVEKEYDLLGNIISTVTRNFETTTTGLNTIIRRRKV